MSDCILIGKWKYDIEHILACLFLEPSTKVSALSFKQLCMFLKIGLQRAIIQFILVYDKLCCLAWCYDGSLGVGQACEACLPYHHLHEACRKLLFWSRGS